MEIKNRIVGEWKLFSEEMLSEGDSVELLISYGEFDGERLRRAHFSSETQIWIDSFGYEYSTEELAEEFTAYCIIRGPWEQAPDSLCRN